MAEQEESPPRTSTREVFARLHKVETEVGELRTVIAGVEVTLQGHGATLARIATTLEQKNSTDWKALASWATVMLGIVGLVGSLILAPMRSQMNSNAEAIGRLSDYRILDTRNQLDDARRQLLQAQQDGRYMERVDELQQQLRDLRGAR